MRRRRSPEPEPEPIDRAQIRELLEEANRLREAGENMHHHPALLALEEAVGSVMAYYVFAFCPDDHRLSAAELDELADGLLKTSAHNEALPDLKE